MLSLKRKVIIGLALAFVLIGALAAVLHRPLERYIAQTSPDGAYTILVLRQPPLLSMMPGQGGDAPGIVQLIDDDGAVLHQEPINMVNLIGEVKWAEQAVIVHPLGEWPLK